MNKQTIFLLKGLRRLFSKIAFRKVSEKHKCEHNTEKVSELIFDALNSNSACMIARFGAFELETLVNYIGVKEGPKNSLNYIRGKEKDWWWNHSLINSMHSNAGFFPPTEAKINLFCELMLQDIPQVDILGSWLPNENYFLKELENATWVNLELLNPYFSKVPWTKALEGKKVLIVHPFSETIEQQYKKRTLLFKNNLLPAFELFTVKAVQSIAGEKKGFRDWFEALDFMKKEIDTIDYDICLIGAGAYGFSLAAHVKRTGKKAVHLGGSLQLLFGIRGKRWENANYNSTYNYAQLINEHWVKPSDNEKPVAASTVEGGCYW